MMIHTPTKRHRLLEMQFPAECHQSVSLFTIAHHLCLIVARAPARPQADLGTVPAAEDLANG